jgi:hypothetical protein
MNLMDFHFPFPSKWLHPVRLENKIPNVQRVRLMLKIVEEPRPGRNFHGVRWRDGVVVVGCPHIG